jgi:hypothetical protein
MLGGDAVAQGVSRVSSTSVTKQLVGVRWDRRDAAALPQLDSAHRGPGMGGNSLGSDELGSPLPEVWGRLASARP